MTDFICANGGTILVVLILAAVVFFIIRHMVRNKRAGRSNCGCSCSGCAGCAMNGSCHGKCSPDRKNK